MSETEAPEELVVTGYTIDAAIARWHIRIKHLARYGEIKKSVVEELDYCTAHRAKLQKLRQQYELEVHVLVEGTSLPLSSVKYLLKQMKESFQTQHARLTEQSDYVEIVVLANSILALKRLRGIYLEGLGTKSTVTDPEIIENAGLLGLR